MSEPRKIEITLEYQNYIEQPPVKPKQLYGNACSADTITIDSWRDIWIKNTQANFKNLGSFKDKSVGKLFGLNHHKPAIIIGSGPSLGYSVGKLKNRGEILAVSCLHNYHLFEDEGVDIDFYVSLDAGAIVIDEVSEGGKKTPEEYWASTKGKALIAFIGSDPRLFQKWQGEIYLFNAPIPDQKFIDAMKDMEEFNVYVSNGGNVLGACLYIAKAIMGSNPIAYVGADFSFGHDKRFHAWDSQYDAKMGTVIRGIDVFGNKVLTWPSYYNFKNWFDWVALSVPGIYVNCTEGGLLGAYPEGNLMAIRQQPLDDFIQMYEMYQTLKQTCEKPESQDRLLLF